MDRVSQGGGKQPPDPGRRRRNEVFGSKFPALRPVFRDSLGLEGLLLRVSLVCRAHWKALNEVAPRAFPAHGNVRQWVHGEEKPVDLSPAPWERWYQFGYKGGPGTSAFQRDLGVAHGEGTV